VFAPGPAFQIIVISVGLAFQESIKLGLNNFKGKHSSLFASGISYNKNVL
jgi:hypothetical protein